MPRGWGARRRRPLPSAAGACPGRGADAGGPALGDAEVLGVWAANKGVPGEGWSSRPPPGAPAPGFYSPHPGT